MAWCLQGLASNEFMSSRYPSGRDILEIRGFQVGSEWIGYSFAYMIPYMLVCTAVLGAALKYNTIEPEQFHVKDKKKLAIGKAGIPHSQESLSSFNLPFIPVDLTFDKIVYEVTASTTGEPLRLLNEVSGIFKAGRMCALMG